MRTKYISSFFFRENDKCHRLGHLIAGDTCFCNENCRYLWDWGHEAMGALMYGCRVYKFVSRLNYVKLLEEIGL